MDGSCRHIGRCNPAGLQRLFQCKALRQNKGGNGLMPLWAGIYDIACPEHLSKYIQSPLCLLKKQKDSSAAK